MDKIGIIGLGNMGSAIAQGILQFTDQSKLMISGPHLSAKHPFVLKHSVAFSEDNLPVAKACDILILAVKPQILPLVLPEIAGCGKLIISIAAGTTTDYLKKFFSAPIIRAMPNTPCLIGKGITGLYGPRIPLVEDIFGRLGDYFWVQEERLMDAVTALSGSGPAYIFHFMECLIEAGIDLGFSKEIATKIIKQTFTGSSTLAAHSHHTLQQLREQVTSKGGTTEAGLNVLVPRLEGLIEATIQATFFRAKQLGIKTDE